MTERCKHELVVGTCATCSGADHGLKLTDYSLVPDPFGDIEELELDVERDFQYGRFELEEEEDSYSEESSADPERDLGGNR